MHDGAELRAQRGFHASAAAAGGRHTTSAESTPERVKAWRGHLSKKAKKRWTARMEEAERQVC